MNKAIIEEQYKFIEAFIAEAKVKFDKKIQEKIGSKIHDMYDNIGEGKTSEFYLKSGNKIILKCISEKDHNYVFEIIEDNLGAFKKWDNVSIVIKTGNGDNFLLIYKLNQKVVSTQDNGESFDLIFNANKKNGLKDTLKLNKVDRVVITNSEPTTEPEEQPNGEKQEPEEQPNGEKQEPEESEEDLEKNGEDALAYMLNDPLLKKAFYEQPSLWNLFVSELKGEKPKGKGIITVNGLIDRYDNKKSSEELGASFIEGKKIWFKPIDTIELKTDKVIKMDKSNEQGYETICLGKKIRYDGPIMEGEINGITYYLEIIKPLEKEEFGFLCKVRTTKNPKDNVAPVKKRIIILDKKSEGFKPNKK
jgi:hypothetical protein